ncbi:MAG: signal peptidase I [Gammaproteobacteria bacterium 28-57-27]|nr:MAG: signal peptidase I [Gammaproteobacteria bacterium 28-57-27]
MNFELILVLLTLVSGVVVAVDRLFFRKARNELVKPDPLLVDYARSFFPVLLAVVVLRSFVAEPFRIPSGSMMPTLEVGDFILVNKFAYGVRLPVLRTKIIPVGEPKRGDVAVFKYPKQPEVDYIKRVIGLPGDRIRYENKQLTINGEVMPLNKQGTYPGDGANGRMVGASEYQEDLAGVVHKILQRSGAVGPEGEFTVPEGQYFMMGDNRDNSNDSRYWGFVPEDNLVGRAMLVWMNFDTEGAHVKPERIGTGIH